MPPDLSAAQSSNRRRNYWFGVTSELGVPTGNRAQHFVRNLTHARQLRAALRRPRLLAFRNECPAKRIAPRDRHVSLVKRWIDVGAAISVGNVLDQFASTETPSLVVFENRIAPPLGKEDCARRVRRRTQGDQRQIACALLGDVQRGQRRLREQVSRIEGARGIDETTLTKAKLIEQRPALFVLVKQHSQAQ